MMQFLLTQMENAISVKQWSQWSQQATIADHGKRRREPLAASAYLQVASDLKTPHCPFKWSLF